ncbi:putative eukaryotic translation initiation factor 2 alpha kinase [Paratrimastix pyriformis]|uniref:Eukaryotic translation initiation factor 2 alpha kinase n=1 Tax=Paratrimastix pyriformis TaxID=342808 RepID=A0ABQ8UT59_9EUKA|nr:putative eukaryotic translation initiation factor 2 alpha kinase [Paratrimastix pyriformis]
MLTHIIPSSLRISHPLIMTCSAPLGRSPSCSIITADLLTVTTDPSWTACIWSVASPRLASPPSPPHPSNVDPHYTQLAENLPCLLSVSLPVLPPIQELIPFPAPRHPQEASRIICPCCCEDRGKIELHIEWSVVRRMVGDECLASRMMDDYRHRLIDYDRPNTMVDVVYPAESSLLAVDLTARAFAVSDRPSRVLFFPVAAALHPRVTSGPFQESDKHPRDMCFAPANPHSRLLCHTALVQPGREPALTPLLCRSCECSYGATPPPGVVFGISFAVADLLCSPRSHSQALPRHHPLHGFSPSGRPPKVQLARIPMPHRIPVHHHEVPALVICQHACFLPHGQWRAPWRTNLGNGLPLSSPRAALEFPYVAFLLSHPLVTFFSVSPDCRFPAHLHLFFPHLQTILGSSQPASGAVHPCVFFDVRSACPPHCMVSSCLDRPSGCAGICDEQILHLKAFLFPGSLRLLTILMPCRFPSQPLPAGRVDARLPHRQRFFIREFPYVAFLLSQPPLRLALGPPMMWLMLTASCRSVPETDCGSIWPVPAFLFLPLGAAFRLLGLGMVPRTASLWTPLPLPLPCCQPPLLILAFFSSSQLSEPWASLGALHLWPGEELACLTVRSASLKARQSRIFFSCLLPQARMSSPAGRTGSSPIDAGGVHLKARQSRPLSMLDSDGRLRAEPHDAPWTLVSGRALQMSPWSPVGSVSLAHAWAVGVAVVGSSKCSDPSHPSAPFWLSASPRAISHRIAFFPSFDVLQFWAHPILHVALSAGVPLMPWPAIPNPPHSNPLLCRFVLHLRFLSSISVACAADDTLPGPALAACGVIQPATHRRRPARWLSTEGRRTFALDGRLIRLVSCFARRNRSRASFLREGRRDVLLINQPSEGPTLFPRACPLAFFCSPPFPRRFLFLPPSWPPLRLPAGVDRLASAPAGVPVPQEPKFRCGPSWKRVFHDETQARSKGETVTVLARDLGQYDADTKNGVLFFPCLVALPFSPAVTQFQQGEGITASGIFDEVTAVRLLEKHSYDGYKDDGQILPGYLYKVHIPVHRNRSLESVATLYDSQMNVLLKFLVRAKGQNAADGSPLSELCSNGNTPTGLMLFDLNSPEDAPTYGPFPINRCVSGLRGNAARHPDAHRRVDRLAAPIPVPWPEAIRAVWQLLTSRLGVAVHENPYGTWPYPYTPQGLISIEQAQLLQADQQPAGAQPGHQVGPDAGKLAQPWRPDCSWEMRWCEGGALQDGQAASLITAHRTPIRPPGEIQAAHPDWVH